MRNYLLALTLATFVSYPCFAKEPKKEDVLEVFECPKGDSEDEYEKKDVFGREDRVCLIVKGERKTRVRIETIVGTEICGEINTSLQNANKWKMLYIRNISDLLDCDPEGRDFYFSVDVSRIGYNSERTSNFRTKTYKIEE